VSVQPEVPVPSGPVLSGGPGLPGGPVLSVRGEARTTVDPDSVTLVCALAVSRDSRARALTTVAGALDDVTADLARLGGSPLTRTTTRERLTWSAQSARTELQHANDERTGAWGPTGLTTATVSLVIGVRAFDLLDRLGQLLAAHEVLDVTSTSWEVDADNPAWAVVRADAIRAAIAKGRDYATALGASLQRVEHVADTGLLGGGDGYGTGSSGRVSFMAQSSRMSAAPPDTPSLDPVPQELTATIEARFVATPVSLTAD